MSGRSRRTDVGIRNDISRPGPEDDLIADDDHGIAEDNTSEDVSWEEEDDYDSDSIGATSSSESVESHEGVDYVPPDSNSIIRRRGVVSSGQATSTALHATRPPGRSRRRHRPVGHGFMDYYRLALDECRPICRGRSSAILLCSFVLWLVAQLYYNLLAYEGPPSKLTLSSQSSHLLRKRSQRSGKIIRNEKQMTEWNENHPPVRHSAFGNAASELTRDAKDGFFSLLGTHRRRRRGTNMEDLPRECELADWQVRSYPTCNIIHEIDLVEALGLRSNDKDTRRYIASGLWRDVWKMPLHQGSNTFVALKLMKGEHDVDSRNLDRHRRDALTMERLTASPYIISSYGHCGNTVVTEYLDRSLDKIMYDEVEDKTLMALGRTRETPLGRLRLSLDVARSIDAMHSIADGPIIHADLQSKQFLVDADGMVKLNDFNRCRFVPHIAKTGKPCTVRIPTAPGRYRAPEEYELGPLTEKIDIYSMAHILYGILAGEEPWKDMRGSHVKDMAAKGKKPVIGDMYLVPDSSDADLAALIDLSYEHAPSHRLSAAQLVNQLERIVASEEAKL